MNTPTPLHHPDGTAEDCDHQRLAVPVLAFNVLGKLELFRSVAIMLELKYKHRQRQY